MRNYITNPPTNLQTTRTDHKPKQKSASKKTIMMNESIKWHPYQSLYPTLKDNFHLHYLPCLPSKSKWWIKRHFAPIQKLKGRCTILFSQKTFKLPKAKKHKAQNTTWQQNPPCPLHLTIQLRIMGCYSFCSWIIVCGS